DQDIETSPLLHRSGHPRLHLSLVGYVHDDGHGRAAVLLDSPHGGFAGVGVSIGDADVGTLAGEGSRDAEAETPISAGHDGHPVLEAHDLSRCFVGFVHGFRSPLSFGTVWGAPDPRLRLVMMAGVWTLVLAGDRVTLQIAAATFLRPYLLPLAIE